MQRGLGRAHFFIADFSSMMCLRWQDNSLKITHALCRRLRR
jgi:hypothetical protein